MRSTPFLPFFNKKKANQSDQRQHSPYLGAVGGLVSRHTQLLESGLDCLPDRGIRFGVDLPRRQALAGRALFVPAFAALGPVGRVRRECGLALVALVVWDGVGSEFISWIAVRISLLPGSTKLLVSI